MAAANRLEANGFTPRFMAPSTADISNAVSYFGAIMKVLGIHQYLVELSYDRYKGVSDINLKAIANRAVQYGVNTSMLEHIGSGYEDLHKDHNRKGPCLATVCFSVATRAPAFEKQ